MYMDVQCILAMRHFVARVPLSSCYGINRTCSTMTGSNKQRFMMLHDVLALIQSDCSKFCELVGGSILQLKAYLRPWNVCWF